MKLLILFGPPAVGKMTVGNIIEQRTDYKLFHNHAIMDSVMHIFGRGTPAEDRLSRGIREQVIDEAANSGINLIFTYVWNFSRDKGKQNIDAYKQLYESRGGSVCFVELIAPQEIRAQRAADPERYRVKAHAPTSDDIANEQQNVKYQSPSPFFYPENYLQIDTTDKRPADIAATIIDWQAQL
jgi:hypothetical protein